MSRWREVHLLLAGLQVPDANAFLLAMTTAAAEQVTSEPLKGLLSWAGRVVSVSSSPQQTAGRRALMIGFALDIALFRDHAFTHVSDLIRNRDRAIDYARGRALEIALDIVRLLDHRIIIDLGHILDLAFEIKNLIIKHSMISSSQNVRFVEACKNIDEIMSKFGKTPRAISQELENALDLPLFKHPFSIPDAHKLVDILTCTRRILECREAAERLTQAGWDRVCERLLAPPASDP